MAVATVFQNYVEINLLFNYYVFFADGYLRIEQGNKVENSFVNAKVKLYI